jgi:hypothetical protein
MPGSSLSVVVDAKDLKPFAVKVLRCTALRDVYRAATAALEGCCSSGRLPRGTVGARERRGARPVFPGLLYPNRP